MKEERIRLTSTNSTNSVDKDAFVNVDIQQHTKVFPFPSVSDTIDQRELFEQERANSTQYRLILTINPYCTNILFNAVTEIVKNEGTDIPNDLCIATKDGVFKSSGNEELNVSNVDMIRNTEYSNTENGSYVYHCGYDIFNNHILRNKSFKLVNPLVPGKSYAYKNTSGDNIQREVNANFNTIRDIMRYADGNEVKLTRRTDVTTIEGVNEQKNQNDARHLYLKDDILSFSDSINENIREENGWWGFKNNSSIPSCEFTKVDENKYEWVDMKISKVFNDVYFNGIEDVEHVSCEFIEMYPDSTLYSFNPKYNRFQNREEQNWDVCIMYPYENDEGTDKILINGSLKMDEPNEEVKYVNGLLLASYKQTKGTSGQDIILFRSYVKHNLEVGSVFKLFYSLGNNGGIGEFVEIKDKQFRVINTGNLKGDYLEYYFYINDVDSVKEALGINEDEKLEEDLYTFRFVKVVNDRDCKYYYRKFRKLPNLRFKKEELTNEIVNNRETIDGNPNVNVNSEIETFESYIDNNCRKNLNNGMIPFNKEQYPLAFARTIYNDANTQIVFTDTIDIDKFTDNLGRPLTELFITFIKRNKGHNIWYNKQKTQEELKEIEFSHCFGKVVSGLQIHGEWSDDDYLINARKELGDCTLLTNEDTNFALDDDIVLENSDSDIIYGDVVEFDRNEMKETVLSDVHFRFNTEQREHKFTSQELNCGYLVFDEIETDDYDRDGFVCSENEVEDATYRPEGYYYKAHYPVKVREFGSMRQASHKEIKVNKCNPKQANGMFIEVVSSLRSGVTTNDIVYLCDENEEIMIPLTVNSVSDATHFLLNPMKHGDENYLNIFEIVGGLMHSDEKIITQEDIDNGYMWVDEKGNENIASEEKRNQYNEVISESDLGKVIFDYSKPKYILKINNKDIPSYAYKVATNLYLWRDILNVGNKDVVELKEYPFANGHFYINKEINFFLKRQDPFNENGLYAETQIPNDIFGNVKKQSNYEYKDEEHRVC